MMSTAFARAVRAPLSFGLPLMLVTMYRCIPDGARGFLFGGRSSSHEAVAGLWNGEGWSAVLHAMKEGHHPNL